MVGAFKLAMQAGATTFAALAIGACVHDCARASDVPPLIGDMKRLVRDVRHALTDAPQGRPHALPGDGPMCSLPLVPDAADDIPERATVERVLASCSRAGRRSDPWAVLTLVRLERDLGAPSGLLLSAVCWETGFQGVARRGDWLDGVARAHGGFQLHAWFAAWCGLSAGGRDDLDTAARCYLSRVLYHVERVQHCARPWVVGEALAANAPRYLPFGCAAMSDHGRELARWRL